MESKSSYVRGFVRESLFILPAIALCLTAGCVTAPHPPALDRKTAADADPYTWMEPDRAPAALAWAKAQNATTLAALQKGRYGWIEKNVRTVLAANDRIPAPNLMGGQVYNFWQEHETDRGVWRRTSLESYQKTSPDWETVLDLDALSRAENENWFFSGANCLAPQYRYCLVSLSRAGKDATVLREFDLARKAFVKDGFSLPEARTLATWVDENTVLVSSDWGPGTLTKSGYPRILRKWTRGTDAASSPVLMTGDPSDNDVTGWSAQTPQGNTLIIERDLTFFTATYWRLNPDFSKTPIAVPPGASLQGVFKNQLIFMLRAGWAVAGQTFAAGAWVSIDQEDVENPKPVLLMAPTDRMAIQAIGVSRDRVFISTLDNVISRLYSADFSAGAWKVDPLPTPGGGTVFLATTDTFDHAVITDYQAFLSPETLYLHSDLVPQAAPRAIKKLKSRFHENRFVVEQFDSKSLDGTRVPYFIVHKKGMPLDGSTPTILWGYGGFEISETPTYLSSTGKVWLEKGGAYALANIRGGDEFGPLWHSSVVKANRHKVFEDFIGVAEDMIARKITSPRRLGIRGGSNGGLLVGATAVLRPDLFNAVSCEVPLLDMIAYTHIDQGYNYIDEYGDPADPSLRPAILAYSPYQNVQAGVKYPRIYFSTAVTDDRVGPGHARKMAARMEAQGHDILFFEAQDGGHSGDATLKQSIVDRSLMFSYFTQQLMDQ